MDLLCPEILDTIFSFLPTEDLNSVVQVCPSWREVAKLSIRRRICFHVVEDTKGYNLRIRDYEKEVFVVPPISETWIRNGEVSPLEIYGQLCVHVENSKLSLLAVLSMKPDWCVDITQLKIKNSLNVEEWNNFGTTVLSLFPNLYKIKLYSLLWFNSNLQRWAHDCIMWLDKLPLDGTVSQWVGTLRFGCNRWSHIKHLILTPLNDEWRSTIKHIEFTGSVPIQDWNVEGRFVKIGFPNLTELKVGLITNEDRSAFSRTEKTVDVEQLKFERTQAFLALKSMDVDSCTKITHLRLQNQLAVQDWNVAGNHVLSKFHSLKELKLNLVFVPDNVSTIEKDSFPSEVVFQNLWNLNISLQDAPNQELLAAREALTSDFVTRCPNLETAHISYETKAECGCSPRLTIKYRKSKSNKLKVYLSSSSYSSDEAHAELCSFTRNAGNYICSALAPMINSLPFTSLRLDHGQRVSTNLEFIQHLYPETFAKLNSLQVCLSHGPEQVAKQFQWMSTLIHRHGYTPLQELELMCFGNKSSDWNFLEDINETGSDLALPNVKKLRIALDYLYDDNLQIFDTLLEALPNVQELLISCKGHFSWRSSVKAGRFLKYSTQFKKLRVLEWDWEPEPVRSAEQDSLDSIRKNLEKHEALESLIVILNLSYNDEHTVEAWKYIVNGCLAAPRMRLLKVVPRCIENLQTLQVWFDRLTEQKPRPQGSPCLQLEVQHQDS